MLDYILGLDLGQSSDYTALVVLERSWQGHGLAALANYACRYLRRWTLGTKYPVIVGDVAALVSKPPLAGATVAVDQTGVGAAVVDMFRDAKLSAELRPVLITGGHQTTNDGGVYHVPKKELVSTLQVLLQSRRLQIARMPERALLVKELQAFRVKVTASANETFEAWRERDHDDMVLAVALAAWLGERASPPIDASFLDHMSLRDTGPWGHGNIRMGGGDPYMAALALHRAEHLNR